MNISNIINFGISSVMSIIGINRESLIFKFNESEKELNTDINTSTIRTNTTRTSTSTNTTNTSITNTTNITSTNNYNFSYLDNTGYGQFYFIYSIDE
jgi:hypothetical protein